MTYLSKDLTKLDVSELLEHTRQVACVSILCEINDMVANCDCATRLADRGRDDAVWEAIQCERQLVQGDVRHCCCNFRSIQYSACCVMCEVKNIAFNVFFDNRGDDRSMVSKSAPHTRCHEELHRRAFGVRRVKTASIRTA